MKVRCQFPRATKSAFTLIEVLIAVGLLALSVLTVLSLLPALTKQGADAITQLQAEQLAFSITSELRRLSRSDFNGLATRIPLMASPLTSGWTLVATRDAERVMAVESPPASVERIAEGQQYYLIECWRFSDEPLVFSPDKDFLALHVRVSWPHRLPDGTGAGIITVPTRNRSEVRCTVSLVR